MVDGETVGDKIDNRNFDDFDDLDNTTNSITNQLMGRARTDAQRDSVRRVFDNEVKPNFLEPEIRDILKDKTKERISGANTLPEVEDIEVSDRFEFGTRNELNRQLGARRAFFERVQVSKSTLLDASPEEIRETLERGQRQKWSAVQKFWRLSDEELEGLQRKIGEDFLS